MNAWFYASATTLARRIRDREVSSEEVVEAHLQRIGNVNQRLNAMVQIAPDQALDEARKADATRAQGRPVAPLHGVPFTVKDWIDAAGLRCTGGDPAFRDHIPAEDATVVARMRQAGAILLGKTNVMVDNPVYGRANNPYNLGYSTTGSSGEAALIAAGGSPWAWAPIPAVACIRQPAHACGVAGLKPTTGRVPLTGHFPFICAMTDPRTVIGPLARFVEDLALALPILAGVDWEDPSVVPMSLVDWRAIDLPDLRVATYTHHAGAEPTPETAETCRKVARLLSGLGARVEETLPPRIEEAAPHHAPATGNGLSPPRQPTTWQAGRSSSTSLEMEQHLFEWDRFRRALVGFMEAFDVILTPAAEQPAARLTERRVAGFRTQYPIASPAGPVSSCALARPRKGCPSGCRSSPAPWREDVALAVSHAIEGAFGGWQPPELD